MAGGRVQRQVDRLLDEAEEALARFDWESVRQCADAVLAFDPENSDAVSFLAAANRALGSEQEPPAQKAESSDEGAAELPTSFAGGRYRVKKFLGEGGKKRVYLTHDSVLDRDVAFAVIKTEGLDETSRTRVSREAQAMGRLGGHPHILPIHDLGDEDGQPYMVLPVMPDDVEGLIEDAPDHRIPLERAVEIAQAVCTGLEFAHSKGVVHRDLKPGNVLLTDDGTAKIGDFGLAVATDRSRLTQEGMMVGTASYMPPEQAMGGEVTAKADLYSLGAMLYELVTGRPPFLGDDSVAIIGQHINTSPVAPTWHNPECPPAMEALVLRLLEKDPANRPASAGEVHEALEAIDVRATHRVAPTGDGDIPIDQGPLYRRTFVGREAELHQLHTAFDNAMSGQGSLMMVVGEPGIGKTSLCEQAATYAALRGGKALVGHCYEEGSLSLPYLAFVEALRSYILERDTDALRDELGSGAADVARIVSEIRERADVEPSAPVEPEEDRYRLLQAVSSFLRNASSVQPLIIVLEDLHDADSGTLDMLKHVARGLSGSRLLIVGTYRDVEVDRSHALSGALAELRRVAEFGRIALRGLTADEVQRMMVSIAGREVPWSLSEAVYRQTEGNPLFVQEVLRDLVEEGHLSGEGSISDAAMSIPEGLRDVIGKRLTRLSQECNRVLSIASVIGREFRLDVLQGVAEVSEEELFEALEEAQGAAVIEERSSAGAAVSFWFTHAFFRQTLYEEMFAPRRIRLHQQVGRALEEVYAGRPEEHAAEMAGHFSQSTERDDLEKALKYGEMAAERSMAVYAHGEAARLLEQALQVQEVLAPDDRAKRCDLLLALGEALMPAGESGRVYDTVAPEAFALAEAMDDRIRLSRTCVMALEAANRYGGPWMWGTPEWRRWSERADDYAEPDTTDRVSADIWLGAAAVDEGNMTGARTLMVRALELARRLDDPTSLFRASRSFLVAGASPPQNEEERWRLVTEMEDRPHVGVEGRTLGSWLQVSSWVYFEWGERARAEAQLEEAGRVAQRTGVAELLVRSLMTPVTLTLLDGRLDEALSASEHIGVRVDEVGLLARRMQTMSFGYRLLLHLGRVEEAMAAVAEAGGLSQPTLVFLMTSVLVRAHLGPSDEAEDSLRRLLAENPFLLKDESVPTHMLVQLLETAVLIEDRELCLVLGKRLAPVSFLSTVGLSWTCPARLLGAAAALLGEPDKARAYYHEALEAAGKIRFRPEIALTRLQLAELLLDPSTSSGQATPEDRAEAMEHLEFAIGEFRDMKMQPSLERALSHRDILGA